MRGKGTEGARRDEGSEGVTEERERGMCGDDMVSERVNIHELLSIPKILNNSNTQFSGQLLFCLAILAM